MNSFWHKFSPLNWSFLQTGQKVLCNKLLKCNRKPYIPCCAFRFKLPPNVGWLLLIKKLAKFNSIDIL